MNDREQTLQDAGDYIAAKLNDIASLFNGPIKVTLIVRHEEGDDFSTIITSDTNEEVMAFLQRFKPSGILKAGR